MALYPAMNRGANEETQIAGECKNRGANKKTQIAGESKNRGAIKKPMAGKIAGLTAIMAGKIAGLAKKPHSAASPPR